MNLPPSQQAILDLLHDEGGHLFYAEIADRLSIFPAGTLRSALQSLESKELVEKEIHYTGKVGQSPRVYKLKEVKA